MVARDDSVIRGSLITCLIFLVLSLALNFILWRWGDTQAISATNAKDSLARAQNEIRTMEEQSRIYKAMLGVGQLSQSEFDSMATSSTGNADMDLIAANFYKNMKVFGADAELQERTYANLPEFFTSAVRRNNEALADAIEKQTEIRKEADSDIKIARDAQLLAEKERDNLQKTLEDERDLFTKERDRILQEREQDRDKVTSVTRTLAAVRQQAKETTDKLTQSLEQSKNVIETQRIRLNELQSDRFENVQGEIRYVRDGGNICSINLGTADALRAGITFGVVDRDARIEDGEKAIKATIQVIKVQGQHLAEARVIARPRSGLPIIEGDYVYSPFWAPGREVKIALAGDIDIDNDGTPDNDEMIGMIQAAGAKVVATYSASGVLQGKMDSSIRFMVTGEAPKLDGPDKDEAAARVAALGQAVANARSLGLTIIPAWKLQGYLKNLDDSLTTPLGSAVKGTDFPVERPSKITNRLPPTLPKLYTTPQDGFQEGNKLEP